MEYERALLIAGSVCMRNGYQELLNGKAPDIAGRKYPRDYEWRASRR